MGFIKDCIETYRIEKDKRRIQEQKYRIVYAFTSGGTKYYRYEEIANLPYERGLMALNVYNELDMRCDRNHLLQHVNAVEKILHQKEIDIFKLQQLNLILKQRLQLMTDVELLYKLASVVFFDSTENPAVYEPAYAEKKIAKWRKDQKVAAFFSQEPLKELIPYLANVEVDLDIFTPINQELNEIQVQALRLAGSTKSSISTNAGKK